jgi:uncharacterized protein
VVVVALVEGLLRRQLICANSGFSGMVDNLDLAALFAAVLVVEGLFPLLLPAAWKDVFRRLTAMTDGKIRFYGLISVVVGVVTWWLLE